MNLFDRFHSVMKKIIIVALCALGVLFVACAEVEYDYNEIDDEIIEIIEIVDGDENIAHKDSIKSSPKPSPKATKATKSTKHTNHAISKDSKDLDTIKMHDSKNTKAESKIPQITLDSENKSQNHKNTFESPTIQPPNLSDSDLLDSTNPQDSHILNKSTPRTKSFFDASKLNLPISQLKAECDSRNLQKCEDLGRIYSVQEKHNLAIAHYKKACDYGKGRVMSCFFLSLIYANNGDNATASEYLNVANVDALNAQIIDEAELLLSIGEIALIKDKLKDSCASGESASCRVLLSVFKIRSEMGEAKAFFSTECKRTKRQNSTPCAILEGL